MLKRIIGALLTLCMVVSLSLSAYADKTTLEKAEELNGYGLFYGMDGGYELEGSVTRAQAAAMALRYVGAITREYISASRTFSDITMEHWADGVIGKAVDLGIARGTTETTFEPEKLVTANEFITFLLRAIGYSDVTLENCSELAIECGMLNTPYITESFTRGDMVDICHQTLSAVKPDGVMVKVYFGYERESNPETDALVTAMSMLEKIQASKDAQDKNFMFSPFSIKMAFMLAANGAYGETREEILSAFGIDDLDKYNLTAKKIIEDASAGEGFELNIANSIWLNTDTADTRFSDEYKKAVSDFYAASAGEVDNSNAVKTINDWISGQTNDKIKDMLSTPDFLAALVNAVYFKADWQSPFASEATAADDFTDKNGDAVQTDFMQQTGYFQYFESESLQAINMPYENSDISMYVFLPKNDIELNAINMSDVFLYPGESERVYIKMPKFKTEFDLELNDIMAQLGISKAFDAGAAELKDVMFTDFPENENAFISSVLHKSFIEVDEKGTEAAAATTILVSTTSAVTDEPMEFIADRPFTYLIRDNANGEILFIGQYSYVQ